MISDFSIEHIATQSISIYGNTYNFREMNEVEGFVNAISSRDKGRYPIFSYWYGCFDNSPESFIYSINLLSDIYSKKSGLRLRGVMVDVSKKNSNGVTISSHHMVKVANRYAEYYIYLGYITGVVVYDMGEFYRIYYLINPVSFWDGGKYRTNKNDHIAEEYSYLEAVLNEVILNERVVDYSSFRAHPVLNQI